MKEDNFTSTVDGAGGWAKAHSEKEDNGFAPDYDDDNVEDELNEEDHDNDCNCSDPGCPCRGYKIGSP